MRPDAYVVRVHLRPSHLVPGEIRGPLVSKDPERAEHRVAVNTEDGRHVAIGPDGTLYLDTFYGNGSADKSAVVSIPAGFGGAVAVVGATPVVGSG